MSSYSRKSSVSRFSLSNANRPLRLSSSIRSASISNVKKTTQEARSKKRIDPKVTISSDIIHTHQGLESFNDLSIPNSTKTLTVQYNKLTNFKGFPSLLKLEKLDVSHNPIESLLEIPNLPSIKTINVSYTPFSNTEFARISLLLLFGSTLRTINGEGIQSTEVRIAKEYPPDCVHLVRAGWIVTYPPPNPQEILRIKKKLSKNFSARFKRRNEIKPVIAPRITEHQSSRYKKKLDDQEREMARLTEEIKKLEAQSVA